MTPTLTDNAPTVTPDAAVRHPRSVERLVTGQATSDGDGVKLTRVLTQPLQRRLDPFLMLDAFGSDDAGDYIGGFPDHPHRGFETVTYMIAGRMRHRDSAGNQGLLENGGVQWMTAGRGLIHSELPEQEEGRMEGFQLWLNLPAADKMGTPGYRDIPTGEIPELRLPGAIVRVIAGASHGVAGAVQKAHTEPLYLDVHLEPGVVFEQPLPAGHNAFVYVYRGELDVDQRPGGVPNLPARKSSTAWKISACLFITNGPYCAIGSLSGRPATSKARAPSAPACTRTPSRSAAFASTAMRWLGTVVRVAPSSMSSSPRYT